MKGDLLRNKRALSPVIATVILVSVTIVVAVSVAYWMGTIASSYTAFEQIELPTSYSEYNSSLPGWNVYVELKNTGSADANIANVFLNEKPLKDYNPNVGDANVTLHIWDETLADWTEQDISLGISIPVPKGSSQAVKIEIEENNVPGCTHGTRINLKFHSAAGLDYPANVRLI